MGGEKRERLQMHVREGLPHFANHTQRECGRRSEMWQGLSERVPTEETKDSSWNTSHRRPLGNRERERHPHGIISGGSRPRGLQQKSPTRKKQRDEWVGQTGGRGRDFPLSPFPPVVTRQARKGSFKTQRGVCKEKKSKGGNENE